MPGGDKKGHTYLNLVERQKTINIIFSQEHFWNFSLSQFSEKPLAGCEPAQNLSSSFVE